MYNKVYVYNVNSVCIFVTKLSKYRKGNVL